MVGAPLTVVETPRFLSDAAECLTEEEPRRVVDLVAANPTIGVLVPDGGGRGEADAQAVRASRAWSEVMTKKAFDKIMEGARQALEIAQGKGDPATYRVHVPDRMDVRAIRRRLGYSQTEFANRFGFRLDTLRKWEQRTRRPEGAARAYLKVIATDPQAVMRALAD